MPLSKALIACLLLCVTFFASVSISGFGFLGNQYVYFRFCEDAGLPYGGAQNFTFTYTLSFRSSYSNSSSDAQFHVQSQTAELLALTGFLWLGSSFVSTIFIGIISDNYGRVVAIAWILLGQGLSFVITTFMVLLKLPVFVIIASSLICGLIGGGGIALFCQTCACFADLSKVSAGDGQLDVENLNDQALLERRRLIYMGGVDAVFVFSRALGNGLMGVMIEHLGFTISSLASLGLFCIPAFLIWTVPDTRQFWMRSSSVISVPLSQTQQVSNEATVNTSPLLLSLTSLWSIFKTQHPNTLLAVIALSLFAFAVLTEGQYIFLFLMSKPFKWTPEGVGLFSCLSDLLMGSATFLLTLMTYWIMRTPPSDRGIVGSAEHLTSSMTSLLNPNDDVTRIDSSSRENDATRSMVSRLRILQSRSRMLMYVFFGFLMTTFGKVVMGVGPWIPAPHYVAIPFVSQAIHLLRGAIVPALKSFLSSLHPGSLQGRLFSVIGLTEYTGLLLGLPIMSGFYAATVSTFSGAVFFFSAAFTFIAGISVLCILFSTIKERRSLHLDNPLIIDESHS